MTTRLGGSGFFGSLEAAYASTSLPLPSFSNSTLEKGTLRLGVESLFFLSLSLKLAQEFLAGSCWIYQVG